MAEEEHPVHIPFHAKDHASGVMHKIGESAEKLGERVEKSIDKLTEMGMAIAGIGGALGFERMVETGRESLEQISKLAKLTGTTADNVAAFRDTFEEAGLGADQFARSMTMLTKKSLMLEEGGKALTKEAKRWGVELERGPTEALISMSAAVQKHKIGQAEVMKLTGVTKENLGGMMELLEQGPEELKKTLEASKYLNRNLADPETLERFHQFHAATVRIHQAWRGVSERVVTALAPALTKMADKLSAWVNSVNVEKFTGPLVKGLELAVQHAKMLGKIMLANAILSKTTGTGLMGTVMKAPALARGAYGIGAGIAGKAAGAAGGLFAGGGGMLAPLVGQLGAVLSAVVRVVGGITGIGLVAGAIYVVIKHLDYFKQRLSGVATALWNSIQKIWGALSKLFSEDSAVGKFVRWVGDKFLKALEFIGNLVAKIIDMVASAIDWISDTIDGITDKRDGAVRADERAEKRQKEREKSTGYEAFMTANKDQVYAITKAILAGKKLTEAQQELYRKFLDLQEQVYGKGFRGTGAGEKFKKAYGEKAPPKGPESDMAPHAGIYQDFRNSRFDIQQKFAEGFDPDRIAVAFANDLGSLGEKRLTSGLTPVFSIR